MDAYALIQLLLHMVLSWHMRYNSVTKKSIRKEDIMEKAATLNLRVNSTVKEMAEEILSRLGVPMSTAINMYLNQIILTGGIPFHIGLPKAPDSVNADLMSKEEIIKRLKKGIQDSESGQVQDADNAFANLSAKLNL